VMSASAGIDTVPVSDRDMPPAQADAVDEQLVGQLVARARANGLQLTGEGGLLQRLTKLSWSWVSYPCPGDGPSPDRVAGQPVGLRSDVDPDDVAGRQFPGQFERVARHRGAGRRARVMCRRAGSREERMGCAGL
jgi:hypothetical protein